MKAAVLKTYDPEVTDRRWVEYEDVADPAIAHPREVIVRVGGAGVCRTDLHVIEGLWQEISEVQLPYIMGHENAGWVEAVGAGVTGFKPGDAVICHPLVTCGHDLACRRGHDMQCEDQAFPGLTRDGGYADYLRTHERTLVRLPDTLAPKDVAPYSDAGLTAYRAAKKAAKQLEPGQTAVMIGAGGLGHIGIQVLRSLCAADIIVVDRAEGALKHAENFGVAHTVLADGNEIERVKELTKGYGAEAVIDFVGEGNAVANGLAMTRDAGTYYIVGYGGRLEIPTMEMVVSEKSIVGNLVGTYPELVELMEMADRGLVDLATREYKLSEANQALHDLDAGQVPGRAVLIP
ncbi:NAD(P)-dependent alcohol dehydrogenase [Salinisphaera japonica]|uniref:alcohol dehydrogenase n=1 Tax=Salinisphaera japonica YTM-1 TaxID=1209778 RepID=A0A423PRZ7_9GAMM|nr:NAD(P)-dependent alcohol dehydrogenase [Salinisphaera japonica]ROO28370.1 alcohol dehydrogenase [Salinisphaera japonica YTM-1]